jgi:hypothetical protein
MAMCVLQRFRCLAKAADAISAGDVVNTSVRRYGNWGLMPFGALMSGVVPATYMRGYRETLEPYEQVCAGSHDTATSTSASTCVMAWPWMCLSMASVVRDMR